jgi:hypothetical protein
MPTTRIFMSRIVDSCFLAKAGGWGRGAAAVAGQLGRHRSASTQRGGRRTDAVLEDLLDVERILRLGKEHLLVGVL